MHNRGHFLAVDKIWVQCEFHNTKWYTRESDCDSKVAGKYDKGGLGLCARNNRANSNGRNNGIEVIAFHVTYARTGGEKTSTV